MFVQFKDESEKEIVSVFFNKQDPDVYPFQSEVEEGDPRYQSFINPPQPEVEVDPVEKLRKFLANNPDVAEIIS